MSDIHLFVGVFVWLFVVVLMFISLNTVIIGNIVPVFDDIANTSGFVDADRYSSGSNVAVSTFYFAFAIMIIAPFIYLMVRLYFKREPEPYIQGGYQ